VVFILLLKQQWPTRPSPLSFFLSLSSLPFASLSSSSTSFSSFAAAAAAAAAPTAYLTSLGLFYLIKNSNNVTK